MVQVMKHEWHQVDSQFELEFDESLLSEIYPDKDEDEIAELLQQLENDELDIDEIINDAFENSVDLEWDRTYDDWWTERKGGYDVTYVASVYVYIPSGIVLGGAYDCWAIQNSTEIGRAHV